MEARENAPREHAEIKLVKYPPQAKSRTAPYFLTARMSSLVSTSGEEKRNAIRSVRGGELSVTLIANWMLRPRGQTPKADGSSVAADGVAWEGGIR